MSQRYYVMVCIGLGILTLWTMTVFSHAADPIHFSPIYPTLTSCSFAGKVSIAQVDAVDGEDEVGVFVSNGNGGEFLAGASVMGQTVAGHYFVNVYADDISTEEKDGASFNDILIFKVWDKSEGKEYIIPPSAPYMVYAVDNDGFLIQPSIPPIWVNESLKPFGFLNFAPPIIPGDINGSGIVGLGDAVLGMKILSSVPFDSTIYMEADINGDHIISMIEVVYALMTVSP